MTQKHGTPLMRWSSGGIRPCDKTPYRAAPPEPAPSSRPPPRLVEPGVSCTFSPPHVNPPWNGVHSQPFAQHSVPWSGAGPEKQKGGPGCLVGGRAEQATPRMRRGRSRRPWYAGQRLVRGMEYCTSASTDTDRGPRYNTRGNQGANPPSLNRSTLPGLDPETACTSVAACLWAKKR